MVHKIALAAIFIQVAITAALATQLVLHNQAAGADPASNAIAAPVAAVAPEPAHTIMALSPYE